jgi:hypothetical protein
MTGGALPRWGSAAVWSLTAAIPIAIVALVLVNPAPVEDAWAIPLYSALVASWGATGALLVTRRTDNRVGWVIWAVGVGMGLALVGQLWATLSLHSYDGALPGTAQGALLGLLFQPALMLVMLVPVLFPDGHCMSRRWALVVGLLLASALLTLVGSLLRPGPIEGMPGFQNPLGVPALAGVAQGLIEVGGIGASACIAAGILAAIVRYRRGTRQERTQLKWFGSVLVLAFTMFLLAVLLPQPFGQAAWIVASLSLGLVPVAIGVAILRYRLYEIDRIISRSIGWTIVTGALLAVFLAGVVGLQAVLADVTEGGTVAVAASTLAAFALFQPLRRRVQSTVDRRFDRNRYDATKTAAAFAESVRDEVDLSRLLDAFVASAGEAVRPQGAAVWLPDRATR